MSCHHASSLLYSIDRNLRRKDHPRGEFFSWSVDPFNAKYKPSQISSIDERQHIQIKWDFFISIFNINDIFEWGVAGYTFTTMYTFTPVIRCTSPQ